MICNGKRLFCVGQEGSLKRCGGQGDVLSGCTALLSYYAKNYAEENKIKEYNNEILYACIGGCLLTRKSAKLAFDKKKRALTAPAIIDEIGTAFQILFEK